MKTAREIQVIIDQNYGTESYYRFSPFTSIVATDGVIAVAKATEGFWLLDLIVSYQNHKQLDKSFQIWELKVNHQDKSAVVRGLNDTDQPIVSQQIPFTDFPLKKFKLYLK